jgi:hypothetical protein
MVPIIATINTFTLPAINFSSKCNMNRRAIGSHIIGCYPKPNHDSMLLNNQERCGIAMMQRVRQNYPNRMAFISSLKHQPFALDKLQRFATKALDTGRTEETITPKSIVLTMQQSRPSISTRTRLYHSSPQRNFFRKGDDNNSNKNDKESFDILGQVKKVAQKFLPSTWFQSEEEKRQIAEQKRIQSDIQTGIKQIFKDAPLPIRMVSNMISPIFGSMMSALAETAASQQDMVEVVYDQAVRSIQMDSAVQTILGDRVTVGRPFSQSSSSSSINGATTTRIELGFPVSGQLGVGIGRLVAAGSGNSNPVIQKLEVEADGNVIDINARMSSSSQRTKSYTPNSSFQGDSNIIDAEIIEKDTKK